MVMDRLTRWTLPALLVSGISSLLVGVALIFLPAMFIVAGLLFVAIALHESASSMTKRDT